jgi:F0F1-type ATP synthase membrane subunit b/b'
MKKLVLAILLASPLALAQPQQMPMPMQRHGRPQMPHSQAPQPHPRQVRAVPPPMTAISAMPPNEHVEADEEPLRAPFKFFDTKLFNNKQPPYAALLFNFVLLLLIYYRFGKKPVANALKERKSSIATAIESAQRILREAKQRSKKYRAKLEKVEADAEQGKQALVSTGHGEAEMLVRGADEKAARLARDAQFLVAQEKKQSHIDLMRETVENAAKEAETLLRTTVTTQDHERLADEFLRKLESDYAGGLG